MTTSVRVPSAGRRARSDRLAVAVAVAAGLLGPVADAGTPPVAFVTRVRCELRRLTAGHAHLPAIRQDRPAHAGQRAR
jgi:hypothetical protein